MNGSLARVGDTIVKGQPIGLSAVRPYSTFLHLHFEVVGNDSTAVTDSLRFNTNKESFIYDMLFFTGHDIDKRFVLHIFNP